MVPDALGLDILCRPAVAVACARDPPNYLRHWRFANCLFPQSSVQGKLPTDCAKAMGKLTIPAVDRDNPRVR